MGSGTAAVLVAVTFALVQGKVDDHDWFKQSSTDPPAVDESAVVVRKCCPLEEIAAESRKEGAHCSQQEDHKWSPLFTDQKGNPNVQVPNFQVVVGQPTCAQERMWPVYHYTDSSDQLLLLPTGYLRHTVKDGHGERISYDYNPEHYCLDGILLQHDRRGEETPSLFSQFAIICVPPMKGFNYFDFIWKVLYPVGLSIAILSFLLTTVLHIIIPQLRDLMGSIVISICFCLLFSYTIGMLLIYGDANPHINLLVAETLQYMSLLAAFLWLNVMGYHIWRIVRARSMFIRVTDQRKYCYFSVYAWGCTLAFAGMALTCHYVLDQGSHSPNTPTTWHKIGWLGMAMFYSPVAFLILVNIYFYVTTTQTLKKRAPHGRILQQMKFHFHLFMRLMVIMTVAWVFQVLSWLGYEAVLYLHMVAAVLQGPLILGVTLCRQRVRFLLSKYFCSDQCKCLCCWCESEGPEQERGEEMLALGPEH